MSVSASSITVRQAMLYVKIMQRLEKSSTRQQPVLLMAEYLQQAFHVPRRAVLAADIVELLVAEKTVHFALQAVVLPAFLRLVQPQEPQEKSAFDEYDAAEDAAAGIEPESPWAIYQKSLEAITQMAIRAFGDSYGATVEAELVPLIEHIDYEIKHRPKGRR